MANNDIGGKVPVGPPGGLDRQPKVPELVHGGFRNNVHHQGIEQMADERGMGREFLRQTEGGYPDEILNDGVDVIMKATPVRGSKEDYKTSKWAK
jgi:hypothetical protein